MEDWIVCETCGLIYPYDARDSKKFACPECGNGVNDLLRDMGVKAVIA